MLKLGDWYARNLTRFIFITLDTVEMIGVAITIDMLQEVLVVSNNDQLEIQLLLAKTNDTVE